MFHGGGLNIPCARHIWKDRGSVRTCGFCGSYPQTTVLFYFRKERNGWLSNFERSDQEVMGMPYPTNEHYYQSQKAADPATQEWIATAPSPWLAMRAGRSLREEKGEVQEGWSEKRLGVMLVGLRAKFTQSQELRARLLATGEARIHEASPTDRFWGIVGEDWLGRLLVIVREELRNPKKPLLEYGDWSKLPTYRDEFASEPSGLDTDRDAGN